MSDARAVLMGLVQRGMPLTQALGFAGNMRVESNFDPGINEIAPVVPGSRGGWGLSQWTGPRRRQFEAYASERGAALDDMDVQLDFLMHELNTTESRARDRIYGATTVEDAARAVSEHFLRPGIPHMDRRIEAANQLAQMYGEGFPETGRGGNTLAAALAAPAVHASQQNALAEFQPLQWRNALDPSAFRMT